MLAKNVHIGTNKVIIILPTSKANHIMQHNTLHLPPNVLHVQLKHYQLMCSSILKGLANFFIRLSGNPVLMQDIAHILNKLSSFLKLPQQLIIPHSLHIGGSSHLYLTGHSLKSTQEKGRWSSQAFECYIHC